jgi:hypothetical protein
MLDPREKDKDHPLSAQLELRQFAREIIWGNLTHDAGISDDRFGLSPRKRKKGRLVRIDADWLRPTNQVRVSEGNVEFMKEEP